MLCDLVFWLLFWGKRVMQLICFQRRHKDPAKSSSESEYGKTEDMLCIRIIVSEWNAV